jgi:hypothetical protein
VRRESRFGSSSVSGVRRCSPRLVAAAAALAALIACGDPYLHTNPYDPAHAVEVNIVGPDTVFSVGEVAHYTAQITPAWPDTGVVWAIDTFTNYFIVPQGCISQVAPGDTILFGDGSGSYTAIRPPLEPYYFKIAIEVWLGTIDSITDHGLCGGGIATITLHQPRHIGYKEVVVMQRVTRIQLRCPNTYACPALAAGDTASIWADGFDARGNRTASFLSTSNPPNGNPILPYASTDTAIQRAQRTNNPLVTYASRDSTIARITPIGIRVAHVTAVSPGSTWIVAMRGVLTDSLQIVVH